MMPDPESPERLVTARRADDEGQYEAGLRPRSMNEYIGQDRIRENLLVSIEAARQRGEALDHVLLYGPPGLGKTTLAHVIANELGVALRSTAGPVLEKAGDLAAILTNLKPREVLFIDEMHTMVGAGATTGGTMDLANLIKPILTEGEIRLMGSTTFDEFKHIEKDRALARRVQRIDVDEPNEGDILFEGASILNRPRHDIPRIGIGRTFQNVALFEV